MYEAASSTAPGGWARSCHITLPQLKNTIITSSTLMIVGSLTYFDLIFVMTNGGPGNATRILPLDMYLRGFRAYDMGGASVVGVIFVPSGWRLLPAQPADRRQLDGQPDGRRCDMAATTRRPNVARAALFGTFWLLITLLPIYYIVVTSLRPRDEYFTSNPLSLPYEPHAAAYREVLEAGFTSYLINSRDRHRRDGQRRGRALAHDGLRHRAQPVALSRRTFEVLLLGIAIPIQATIVPVYYLIVQMGLYDTLLALILPSIAFAIPISVLILVNFVRDIPRELFESMRMDGASSGRCCGDWSHR